MIPPSGHEPSSEPAFEALFAQVACAALIIREDSLAILQANPLACDLLGYSPTALLQCNLTALAGDEDRPRLLQFLADLPPPQQFQRFTGSLLPADRYSFATEITAQRLHYHNCNCILLTFQDLSERIRASQDIALRNIAIANVHSGVTIADARQPDLPLIYVNRGFQEMTGYSAKEAVGRSCRFLQGSDNKQPQLEELRAALREGRSCVVRLRNYRKDGSMFYNELHISPVRDEQDQLTHFVGIQIDVTERERTRERLTLSEARYRQLANTVDDLIIRRDADDVIEFASSASVRLLGVQPQQLIGMNLKAFVHPEDRASMVAQVKRILQSEGPRTVTFRMRQLNGIYRWFESRDRLITDPQDESAPLLLVSVIRDITLRKRAEEETRNALEKEREINEMKTAFISMVSHEFRTPMTGIQSSATLLRKFGDKLSEDKKVRHLENIESALKRMNRLLDDVLFFSRAEANKIPVNPATLNLSAYLHSLTEDLLLVYPRRQILLHCNLPDPPCFDLDEHLLNHILQNLVGNALKYSPANRPVEFLASCADNELLFTIKDSGIGIPLEDQKKLFEAFHRAHNVGTIQGTGIGLNIAQRAVELLRGRISFQSEQGVGSVFTVTLPIHAPDANHHIL